MCWQLTLRWMPRVLTMYREYRDQPALSAFHRKEMARVEEALKR